jgi:hypothetical protein
MYRKPAFASGSRMLYMSRPSIFAAISAGTTTTLSPSTITSPSVTDAPAHTTLYLSFLVYERDRLDPPIETGVVHA